MQLLRKSKIHYGWFVVLASFLIMSVGFASVYNCASLFVKPITEDLGFSRSQFNVTMTIRAACQVAVSLLAGKIFRPGRLLLIMKAATLVLIGSFLMYSFAHTLLEFYVLSVLVAVALSLITVLPISIILSNWFETGRGGALGLAFMGSGVGGMILSALTGMWIEDFGWRIAYQILTVLMVIFVIPSVFLILKVKPEDIGLKAIGASTTVGAETKAEVMHGLTLAQASHRVSFWALNIASVLMIVAINALMMNVAPHLADIGYSISFSANVVALVMGSLAFGKFFLGKLFDGIGLQRTVIIAGLANILALVGMVLAPNYLGLALTILFVGVGCAYATIAPSVLTIEMYGRRDYNAILGILTAVGSMGSVIGPIMTGIMYDASGDYYSSFMLSIVFCVIALAIYTGIFLHQRRSATQLTAPVIQA